MIEKTPPRLTPFSADLHIHSALSPCAEDAMTPRGVVKKIVALGIEIFSITDHNAVFNCAAFAEAARERDVLFIPGIELQTMEEIHLLGYFPAVNKLDEFHINVVKPATMAGIKNDPYSFGRQLKMGVSGDTVGDEEDMLSMPLSLTIDQLVNSIHEYGGAAVAAHLDRGFSLISQLGFLPPGLGIDAVEIWNVNEINGLRSKFLQNCSLPILSSSDSHHLDMMKPSKMNFMLKKCAVEDCLDCIRGVGPGRITVHTRPASMFRKRSRNTTGSCKKIPGRDWRSLYE